jgi:hypothetical protein
MVNKKELSKKQRHTFKPMLIEITKNLDYKVGGAGLLSGKIMLTIPCPKHLRDRYFHRVWVKWMNKPLMLECGEYAVHKQLLSNNQKRDKNHR